MTEPENTINPTPEEDSKERKPYIPPQVESQELYETRALACNKTDEIGLPGGCSVSFGYTS